jgi:hypothetical protein
MPGSGTDTSFPLEDHRASFVTSRLEPSLRWASKLNRTLSPGGTTFGPTISVLLTTGAPRGTNGNRDVGAAGDV